MVSEISKDGQTGGPTETDYYIEPLWLNQVPIWVNSIILYKTIEVHAPKVTKTILDVRVDCNI